MAKIKYESLTLEQCAELLTASGSKSASVELIKSFISSGMPTNADGTIGLPVLAAWILKVNHG